MARLFFALLLSFFIYDSHAQKAGSLTAENQPEFNFKTCTGEDKCEVVKGTVTLDANWRWTHSVSGPTNCYTGKLWDTKLCPNSKECTANCVIDGADYKGTYGVSSTGDALTLKFINVGPYSTSVGSRLYLLDSDTNYQMFMLLNKEFAFDVDVSNLACGLNGALYFAAMPKDGGKEEFKTAGSQYGLNYCDAQCPQDLKWINGVANSDNWIPSKTDPNVGTGDRGSCCPELDIWEANSISQAFTPHVCKTATRTICNKDECGNGPDGRYKSPCDKDGCDFASYRWGAKTFYGPGQTLDTKMPMTVITQFFTSDNTDAGDLIEVRRVYKQGTKVILNEAVSIPASKAKTSTKTDQKFDSITQDFCDATKDFTGDINDFKDKGGLKAMGEAMRKGMVLVMSLWDDQMANMDWLDGNYPPKKPESDPGVARGTCSPESGFPKFVRANHPDATVVYSNVKVGPIGSISGIKDKGDGAGGAGAGAGAGAGGGKGGGAGTATGGTRKGGGQSKTCKSKKGGGSNSGSSNP